MAESIIGGGYDVTLVTMAENVIPGSHIPPGSGNPVIGNSRQYIGAGDLITDGASTIVYGYSNEIQNVAIQQPIYANDVTGTSTAPTTGKFIHR